MFHRARKKLGFNGHGQTIGKMDPSELFVRRKVAVYLERYLATRPKLTRDLYAALYWLLGEENIEDSIDFFVQLQTKSKRNEFEEDLRKALDEDPWDFCSVMDELAKGDKKGRRKLQDFFLQKIQEASRKFNQAGMSDLERNLELFRKMFGLTELETEICLYLFITESWRALSDLFNDELDCNAFKGRKNLSTILGCSVPDLSSATSGNLVKSGLVDSDPTGVHMEDAFISILQSSSNDDLTTVFFKKVDTDPLPLEAHVIDGRITESLLALLANKSEKSTHIVLYGPREQAKRAMLMGWARSSNFPYTG